MSYSIFEIHRAGYTSNGFGSASGIGFLITKSLALTASSVIPDESVAGKCFARFVDNLNEVHEFNCSSFFCCNKELNFTVLAFRINPDCKKPRLPIEFREEFVLRVGDAISYLNCGNSGKSVTSVDEETLIYTVGSPMLPGMPLFTLDGKLQGFHHTCTSSYRFNQGTRIDVVVRCLASLRSMTHPELEGLFSMQSTTNLPLHSVPGLSHPISLNQREDLLISDEGRYIYWVEWFNKNIYRYDIFLQKWAKVTIYNFEDFEVKERIGWTFNWGSRIVYTSASLFIIGGVGHEASATKSDVFELNLSTFELFRRKDMIEKREGPAVVTRGGFLYVLGGKYCFHSCEKYSFIENKWEIIAPMNFARYEPVAVVMNDERFIFVVGGAPAETVGKSIERFSFADNHWDVISVVLHSPVLHPAIFPISYRKFALLGGKYSKSVLVFDVGDGSSNEIVYQEIEKFPEPVETLYPPVHFKQENKIFIVKSQEGSAPQVLFYNFQNFHKVKLPPIT
jgi:hypothetical protein